MPVQAVTFDIGGVLEVPTDTDLEGRWEQRLGLARGEFFQRLRQSGLGRESDRHPEQRRRGWTPGGGAALWVRRDG
jgi:hypothetical protein